MKKTMIHIDHIDWGNGDFKKKMGTKNHFAREYFGPHAQSPQMWTKVPKINIDEIKSVCVFFN